MSHRSASAANGNLFEDFGSTRWDGKPRSGSQTTTARNTTSSERAQSSKTQAILEETESDDELDSLHSNHDSDFYSPMRKKVIGEGNRKEVAPVNGENLPCHPSWKGMKIPRYPDGPPASSLKASGSQQRVETSSKARSIDSDQAVREPKPHKSSSHKRFPPPPSPSDKQPTRNDHMSPGDKLVVPPRPKPRPLAPGTSRVSLYDLPESPVPKKTAKKPTLAAIDAAAHEPEMWKPKEFPDPSGTIEKTKNRPRSFPNMSPLRGGGNTSRAKKPDGFPELPPLSPPRPLKPAPFPLDRRNDCDDDDEIALKPDDDELTLKPDDEIETRGGLRPFPMNTQMLSIGSQLSPPRPSPRKRSLAEIADGNPRKKRRGRHENRVLSDVDDDDNDEEEEDNPLFLHPSTDPHTLCPYCDAPLPTSATTTLTRLLVSAAEKSYSDPRPSNPLGRRATLASFIGVCQRHRFESEILPEGEARGWPKEIEWDTVRGRVEGMTGPLRALIADGDREIDGDGDGDGARDRGPRTKCVFWRDVMKEVREQGSRAVVGVRGQFASFEKTQPGYYGELGAVIIHQTLYNLFPPVSFDASLIAPLTPNEFIQRILVPEVGVRLIMQDNGLTGDEGVEEAVKILRESAVYGVAMFPEDGGEWGGGGTGDMSQGGNGDGGLGAADKIVMERAQKRRKELEVEEREENEFLEREKAAHGKRQPKTKIDKCNGKSNGKGKQRAVELTDVSEASDTGALRGNTRTKAVRQAAVSEAASKTVPGRPIPIPLKKQTTSTDVDTEEGVENVIPSPSKTVSKRPKPRPLTKQTTSTGVDTDKNLENLKLSPAKPKPKRRVPSVVAEHEGYAHRTRNATPRARSQVVLDLCSSSDAESPSEDGETEAAGKYVRRGKAKRKNGETLKNEDVEMVPRSTVDSDAETTPRPSRIAKTDTGESSHPSPSTWSGRTTLPLVAARQRKRRLEHR